MKSHCDQALSSEVTCWTLRLPYSSSVIPSLYWGASDRTQALPCKVGGFTPELHPQCFLLEETAKDAVSPAAFKSLRPSQILRHSQRGLSGLVCMRVSVCECVCDDRENESVSVLSCLVFRLSTQSFCMPRQAIGTLQDFHLKNPKVGLAWRIISGRSLESTGQPGLRSKTMFQDKIGQQDGSVVDFPYH